MQGLRLCTERADIRVREGVSYGICSLTPESAALADAIPGLVLDGSMSLFPITSGEKLLGVALLGVALAGAGGMDSRLDTETTTLIEGILNGVAVAIEGAAAAQATRRSLEESESLRRVADRLLRRPGEDVGGVFALICDEARNLLAGSGSAILLKDGDTLRLAHAEGPGRPADYPIAQSPFGEIFRTGKVSVITDAVSAIPAEQRGEGDRTLIAAPLRDDAEDIGLILVSNKTGGFDLNDRRVMEMFAAQAVLALRNARLAEQGARLAVAGERQRLARELHDSVTQALYAANLCADAAGRSLAAGKGGAAAEQIGALRGMTRQAMRDMRSLIFDLHPPELEREGLTGALRSRLNAVEGRSGLDPDLRVTGRERRLPILVEEELFRIAIEALNNAAKHSRAERVTVEVGFEDCRVCLAVTDNGRGFDVGGAPTGGLGLRGMRERAARISAAFEIHSSGDGTTVRACAPVDSQGAP